MNLMDSGGETASVARVDVVGGSPEKDISDINPYDSLSAVERLERYIVENKCVNKRAVAQAVVDTLRVVSRESPLDVTAVLEILCRLAEDPDSQLRTVMMVQVPQIALLCYENSGQLAGELDVEGHLLPLVIKTLTDVKESVRKTAQTALIMLMEQNLVTSEAIEDQVFPVVLMLADMGTLPDYHSSAVMLMSKMAPLLGKEKSRELLLDHFVALCRDAVCVRTVCASNIGEFCTLMGTEVTEQALLPCFVDLCKDSNWGVRKECANVFQSVSCVVTLETRKKVLAPIFVELLRDQSRWVKVAAFHSLGPFIWSFAPDSIRNQEPHSPGIDPDTPRSSHPQNEISRLRFVYGVTSVEDPLAKYMSDSDQFLRYMYCDADECSEKNQVTSAEVTCESEKTLNVLEDEPKIIEESPKVEGVEPASDFNTFLYWRLPLPEVGADAIIENSPKIESHSNSTSTVSTAVVSDSQNVTMSCVEDLSMVDQDKVVVPLCSSNEKTSPTSELVEHELFQSSPENKDGNSDVRPSAQLHGDTSVLNEIDFREDCLRIDADPKQEAFTPPNSSTPARGASEGWAQTKSPAAGTAAVQDIVPQALLDHYISMSTPQQFIEEDPELAHHCAFNFPAVALTLGRENWPLLSGAYEILAVDVQWKVRRTLASSIHELAVILGEELATRYLVPVFNGFAKDLDEVRIGVVKHLAEFLKVIGPAGRNECLPCLFNLLMTDNPLNWRFRDELTRQLMQVTNLFSPKDVRRFLTHIGMALLFSKVAAVRHNATQLLAEHIRYLSVDKKLVESLLVKLAKEFARSGHWMRRQSYACLCEQLLVPQSRRETRPMGDGDDDEDESYDRGHYTSRDNIHDEWIDESQEDTSWRTRIAPLLAQHVYPYLLDLSCDKVPNVRLAVARVLGSFQATPAEQNYLHSYLDEAGESDGGDTKRVPALEIALAQLQKDKDRDVQYFASRYKLSCSPNKSSTISSEVDVVNGLISPL